MGGRWGGRWMDVRCAPTPCPVTVPTRAKISLIFLFPCLSSPRARNTGTCRGDGGPGKPPQEPGGGGGSTSGPGQAGWVAPAQSNPDYFSGTDAYVR